MLLRVYLRWLAVTAAAYVVFHHLGLIDGGLGPAPSDTQWIDWFDLVVPFLVLGPAAATLHAAGAGARTWLVFGIGAVTYATGHGVHLAANSVGNAAPGPTEHLWDEVVGHYIWYTGVALVVAALAMTMSGRPRPLARRVRRRRPRRPDLGDQRRRRRDRGLQPGPGAGRRGVRLARQG